MEKCEVSALSRDVDYDVSNRMGFVEVAENTNKKV
jgi:hypothetical protein